MTETRTIERRPGGITLDQVVELTGFQPAEIALIARTVAVGAPLQEVAVFLHACRQLQLDPLLRQAYWIRRKQPNNEMRGTLQIGIDGFRSLADRQGSYAGSSEPIFRGSKVISHRGRQGTVEITVPEYCQVITWKIVQGHKATFVGEARWDEFYPGDGEQGFMWRKMPHHQLAKCAEAQSLRKGWPAQLGGLEFSPEADAGPGVTVEELPEVQPARRRTTRENVETYDRIFVQDDDPRLRQTDPEPEPPEPEPEEPAPEPEPDA